MIKLKLKYTSNRKAVTQKAEDAAQKVAKRFGAYVMTSAKQSIRKGTKKSKRSGKTTQVHSKPGDPPKSQQGDLKRFIIFAWDPSTRSVVIGPKLFQATDTLEALEHGKTTTRKVLPGGPRRKRSKQKRARSDAEIAKIRAKEAEYRKTAWVQRSVRYAARPYMQPALKKRLPELPALWRGAIK